ncbi:hypothetical protein K1719_028354 [Acacia pycnantha]|nr:hypothetical protein K1719_028354 [Acacia pycnantha]
MPSKIGNLTKLREHYIGYYNAYDGGLPPEIGNLSELVRFNAANCGLTGEIPSEIRKLQELDTLFLQVNVLSGPLTPELGKEEDKDEGDEEVNWLISFNDSSKLSQRSIRLGPLFFLKSNCNSKHNY